jgi:hypothetical protein
MTEKRPPSWSHFEERQQAVPPRGEEADEYAELSAVVFTSAAGRRLLAFLHARFIDDIPKRDLTEGALREWLGRRQVVRELEEQTAKGLELLKERQK